MNDQYASPLYPHSGKDAAPQGSGGGEPADKHKNNMSGAQSNPMYKENSNQGTNPLYEKDSKEAAPKGSAEGTPDAQQKKNPGDYNLSTKFSVEISGKEGSDLAFARNSHLLPVR